VTSVATLRLACLLAIAALLLACGPEEAQRMDVPSWAHVAPEQIAEAARHGVPVAFENDLGMRFVLIPAGTFVMGSPEGEEGRGDDETQHEVTISEPFYLQVTEVTNEQYRRLVPDHLPPCDGDPLDKGADDLPVVEVSWHEVSAFATWLSGRDEGGRTYRLPTEAEWEYACRAGTTGRYFWGSDPADAGTWANVRDRELARWEQRWVEAGMLQPAAIFPSDDGYVLTAPVASFRPNAWGLYDMLGNVAELCADRYARFTSAAQVDAPGPAVGDDRVRRGGTAGQVPALVRCASRLRVDPTMSLDDGTGFRLVSPLPEPGGS